MTNTRITDPESLEQRYPVVLRQFSFRAGSGGKGAWNGGEGVIRDVEFRAPMCASILSERRSLAPYGMEGGSNAQRGRNTRVSKASGLSCSIGEKGSVNVEPGDRMVIETPGGGGYGEREDAGKHKVDISQTKPSPFVPVASGSVAESRALAEQA